jgi:hypothetical protein
MPSAVIPPVIPDHTLLRPIGRGAYGEVWLARNVMGAFRAVKVIWRSQFESERPYEREFAGIQRYEPVSRSSSGLVHVESQWAFSGCPSRRGDEREHGSAKVLPPVQTVTQTFEVQPQL